MKQLLEKRADQKSDAFNQEIINTFFGKSEQKKELPTTKNPLFKKKFSPRIIYIAIAIAIITPALYVLVVKTQPEKKKNLSFESNSYKRILSNGIFDRSFIKSFSFQGDAMHESSILNNSIKIVNKEKTGWARADLSLDGAFDFSGRSLIISGKSNSPKGAIAVILTDVSGRTYRAPTITFSPEWQVKNIRFKNVKKFDLKAVNNISMECGSETTGNADNVIIYIKEIGLRKRGV